MDKMTDYLVPGYAALCVFTATGIITQLIAGLIYLRRIKCASKTGGKRKGLLEKMYRNYKKDAAVAEVDVEKFVRKELSINNSLGLSAYKLGRFTGLLSFAAFIFTAGSAGYMAYRFLSINKILELHEDLYKVIIYSGVGLSASLLLLIIKKLAYLKEKEECLYLVTVNYFEAVKSIEACAREYERSAGEASDIRRKQAAEISEAGKCKEKPEENQADFGKIPVLKSDGAGMEAAICVEEPAIDLNKSLQPEITESENYVRQNVCEDDISDESGSKIEEKNGRKIIVKNTSDNTDSSVTNKAVTSRRLKNLENLNQTLSQAYPQKKLSSEEEKLIEEVLKEYLFR